MKNIFLLMVTWLSCQICYSQTQSQHGITLPTPTAASLATYTNIPVSIQTGVPNISYPLISVPTNNKFVEVSLGLNYHTANVDNESWVSNVGKGWSLLGAGAITREILDDFDESFDDISFHNYHRNDFDDIYNFNIPGESGKFRVIRDTLNNTFQIIKLSPYTSTVKYSRNSNDATLIIDSFTVTTDKGIQYIFQDYDISIMNVWTWTHPWTGDKTADKKYRSAFYPTKILDENGQELVKYVYVKDLIYFPGTQITKTETNKLTHIAIKDRGNIDINTTKDDPYNDKNDTYKINDITLKTYDNRFIKKYSFVYSYPFPNLFRTLDSFAQTDYNGNIDEKYGFEYSNITYGSETDGQISSTALKRIKLPTKGVIEYDFDLIPYAYTSETIHNPAPTEPLGDASFDKVNQGQRKYFFTVLQTSEITINSLNISNLHNYQWALQFYKKVGNTTEIAPYSIGSIANYTAETEHKRTFEPGEYYAEVFTSEPFVTLYDSANFNATIRVGDPFDTTKVIPLKGISRIKKIKYFDLDYSNIQNFSIPSRSENYEYTKFDNPSLSSGYLVEGGSFDGGTSANPVIIYKNVKVSKGAGTGYTKYYFSAPDRYTIQPESGVWSNFNILREGLLDKKEAYNISDEKVSEEIFDYTFEEYDSPKYLVIPAYVSTNFYLKTTWIRNQSSISRNFFGSGVAEAKQEVFRSPAHYFVSLERATAFDGSIQETSYLYPLEKNNQKLLTANMTSLPLETKTMIKKNNADAGIVMARSETKYENAGNKFPSSAVSYDSQNILASEVIFNQYDSKGNLEEYTTKDGIPVSLVWGYNKTQPIAKIEGATYSQVSPYISDMVTRSDADTDSTSEQVLQNALDLFRNKAELAGFQITTYVYDPLVGMKSMTPPSGIREIYQYDKAGRLDKITDENGNVLKKYKYNYKQ